MVSECRAICEQIFAFRNGQSGNARAAPEARNIKAGAVRIRPLQAVSGKGTVDQFRV